MKKLIITIAIIVCSCSPRHESPLTDEQINSLDREYAVAMWKASKASTDECSSPAPIHWLANKFLKKNWSDCCWQHDFDYHYGYLYHISKDQADYALWECVAVSGHPVVADMIYTGVRIGGSKSYKDEKK